MRGLGEKSNEERTNARMNEGAAKNWEKVKWSFHPYSPICTSVFCLTGSKVGNVGNRIRGKVDLKAVSKAKVGFPLMKILRCVFFVCLFLLY